MIVAETGLHARAAALLSPRELDEMVAGARWRRERQLDRAVVVASFAARAGGMKNCSPAEILGRALGDSMIRGLGLGNRA